MKNDLLNSVVKRIEILETTIFNKDSENDGLKNTIEKLDKQLDEHNNEVRNSENTTDKFLNTIEKHNSLNSIRINGISEEIFDKVMPIRESETRVEVLDEDNQEDGCKDGGGQKIRCSCNVRGLENTKYWLQILQWSKSK